MCAAVHRGRHFQGLRGSTLRVREARRPILHQLVPLLPFTNLLTGSALPVNKDLIVTNCNSLLRVLQLTPVTDMYLLMVVPSLALSETLHKLTTGRLWAQVQLRHG